MSLYTVGCKELLSKALPGNPFEASTMLAALEEVTMKQKEAVYHRIYSWWILVQTWCTLHFSDHRGISPQEVTVDASTRGLEEIENDRDRQVLTVHAS